MTSERSEKMARFLALIPLANWRTPPRIWNEELREALNDRLVTVGWGDFLRLTDAGDEVLKRSADA